MEGWREEEAKGRCATERPLRNGRLRMATSDATLHERGSFDQLSYAPHVRDNDADVAANRGLRGSFEWLLLMKYNRLKLRYGAFHAQL